MEEGQEESLSSDSNQIAKRDEKGRLLPGSILNTKGRIAGSKNFTTLVKEAMDGQKIKIKDTGVEIPYGQFIIQKILNMAAKGDRQIIKLIWNYMDGLPKGSLGIEQNNYNFNFGDIDLDEVEEAGFIKTEVEIIDVPNEENTSQN